MFRTRTRRIVISAGLFSRNGGNLAFTAKTAKNQIQRLQVSPRDSDRD